MSGNNEHLKAILLIGCSNSKPNIDDIMKGKLQFQVSLNLSVNVAFLDNVLKINTFIKFVFVDRMPLIHKYNME